MITAEAIIKAATRYAGIANSYDSDVTKALLLGKEEGFIAGAEWAMKQMQSESLQTKGKEQ